MEVGGHGEIPLFQLYL